MAARRLIIVMLVLLGISTAVAIIAPDPAERTAESGATGSTTREEAGEDGPTGTTGATGSTGETGETGATGGGAAGGAGGGAGGTGGQGATGAVGLAFTASDKPQTLCARPGSRVILTVKTTEPLDVSIPDFGRTASVTQYAPEPFDLLLPDTPGSYDVEVLATGRTLATIKSNDSCRPPK